MDKRLLQALAEILERERVRAREGCACPESLDVAHKIVTKLLGKSGG